MRGAHAHQKNPALSHAEGHRKYLDRSHHTRHLSHHKRHETNAFRQLNQLAFNELRKQKKFF